MSTNNSEELLNGIFNSNYTSTILLLIQKLHFAIHTHVSSECRVDALTEKNIRIRQELTPKDISSLASLFHDGIYFHDDISIQPDFKSSLANLDKRVSSIDNESKRITLQSRLNGDIFDLSRISDISTQVQSLRFIRNEMQHTADYRFEKSKAILAWSVINHLLTITPDSIIDSIEGFDDLNEFLKEKALRLNIVELPEEEITEEAEVRSQTNSIDFLEIDEIFTKKLNKEFGELKRDLNFQIKQIQAEHNKGFNDLNKYIRGNFQDQNSETKNMLSQLGQLFKKNDDAIIEIIEEPEINDLNLDEKKIQSTVKPTRAQTRDSLLAFRTKIIEENSILAWDCILNSKIVENILSEKIYTKDQFRSSNSVPCFIYRTLPPEDYQEERYIEGSKYLRDNKSKKLMTKQLDKYWGEIQKILAPFYFEKNKIIKNRLNKPWAPIDPHDNKTYWQRANIEDMIDRVVSYLSQIDPNINKHSYPFNSFSSSFIKKFDQYLDIYKNFEVYYQTTDEGFVITIGMHDRLLQNKSVASQVNKESQENISNEISNFLVNDNAINLRNKVKINEEAKKAFNNNFSLDYSDILPLKAYILSRQILENINSPTGINDAIKMSSDALNICLNKENGEIPSLFYYLLLCELQLDDSERIRRRTEAKRFADDNGMLEIFNRFLKILSFVRRPAGLNKPEGLKDIAWQNEAVKVALDGEELWNLSKKDKDFLLETKLKQIIDYHIH